MALDDAIEIRDGKAVARPGFVFVEKSDHEVSVRSATADVTLESDHIGELYCTCTTKRHGSRCVITITPNRHLECNAVPCESGKCVLEKRQEP